MLFNKILCELTSCFCYTYFVELGRAAKYEYSTCLLYYLHKWLTYLKCKANVLILFGVFKTNCHCYKNKENLVTVSVKLTLKCLL